jgi:hypothetical protein
MSGSLNSPLRDEEGIDIQASRELIDAKKARFKQMRQISRELGTLVTKPKALCLHGILVELGDGFAGELPDDCVLNRM